MVPASRFREERRAALFRLQRLLIEAESFLSNDEGEGEEALRDVAVAFEHYRRRQESEEPAAPTAEREVRRTSVVRLAKMLKDVDEAVAKGDAENVAAAVSIVREALHLTRRLDETSDASGFRQRFPIDVIKLAK